MIAHFLFHVTRDIEKILFGVTRDFIVYSQQNISYDRRYFCEDTTLSFFSRDIEQIVYVEYYSNQYFSV